MMDDDDNGEPSTIKAISGPTRAKKAASSSTPLIDVVSILASAKSTGEQRKFDFLTEQLQQQREFRWRELDLERERLELERKKTEMEQRKTELMMKQLEESVQMRLSQTKKLLGKGKEIMKENEEGENDHLFILKDI